MKIRNIVTGVVMSGLLLSGLSHAEESAPVERAPVDESLSFEDGVPAYVSVEKGTLSCSENVAQDGKFSLRWDWVPGDRLTLLTQPMGDIGVWTGYGGYFRSCIQLRLFNETVSTNALAVRWMAEDKQGGMFEFPLHVEGWQRICYHYSWHSNIKKRNREILTTTDRLVIDAPPAGEGGTIYLDTVTVNTPRDWREKSHPVTDLWTPYDIMDYSDQELLAAPPTAEELAAVERLLPQRDKNGKTTEAQVAALEKNITEKYAFRHLENGRLVGRSATWNEMTADMDKTAGMWLRTGDDALAQRVAEVYFMLDDHFRTLGAVPQGSIRGLNNYVGRTHGNACFKMRKPLLESGRLERVRQTLEFNYNHARIFRDGPVGGSMDFHYNEVRYLFMIALMHETPEEIVKHLRVFKDFYDRAIVGTIKPDGSLYHHGAHYYAYAGGAMASTADTFMRTLNTPFQPSREAFEAVKRAYLNMRYYANVRDLPVTLHGRHPGRQQLYTPQFLRMAEIGRVYSDGKLDPELAACYLRLNPEDADKPMFVEEGITPEKLEGNLSMNFAGLMGHRRDDWLAMVRGYSKYYWAQESYADANRHGLFMGNGCLDILATGDPINIIDSGCVIAEGWDWRHFDGSTAIDLPYAKMAIGNGSYHERNGTSFVGGLTHRGRQGVFVMPLRSGTQYGKAMDTGQTREKDARFEANKTYFFFDDRIVCLGEGIQAPDVRYPVVTTLFQKHLKTPDLPVVVNGKSVTALDAYQALDPAKAHTLLDIQQTGYYIPAGQHVRIARRRQLSRDGHDKNDTEGDHALAWFDHGRDVRYGAYEYIIRVRTTPEAMAEFAETMQGETPPVQVLRKDPQAHIVYDTATRTTGHVIFDPAFGTHSAIRNPQSALLAVSRPCLVMQEHLAEDRMLLSVADPDLHIVKGEGTIVTELELVLAGDWKLASASPEVTIKPTDEEQKTTLLVTCHQGRSYECEMYVDDGSE